MIAMLVTILERDHKLQVKLQGEGSGSPKEIEAYQKVMAALRGAELGSISGTEIRVDPRKDKPV